jgi:hypothetical protein
MNRVLRPRVTAAVMALLLSAGCGGAEGIPGSAALQAVLAAPPLGAVGIPVVLNGSGSRGQAPRYRFEFGDGQFAQGAEPFAAHAYREPGTYSVRLEVRDRGGRTSLARRTVRILAEGQRDFTFTPPSDAAVPALWEIPFPNDLYRDAQGRLRVTRESLEKEFGFLGPPVLAGGLEVLNGFGLTTAVYFPLENAPLPETLPGTVEASRRAGSSVCLINVDPGSSGLGDRHPIEVRYDLRTKRLVVLPAAGFPLLPGTRYAVVISSGLVSPAGPYVPPEAFLALRDGRTAGRTAAIYQPLWLFLEGSPDLKGLAAVSMATVFTTQDTPADLVALRSRLETLPPGRFDLTRPDRSRIYDTPAELDALLGVPLEDRPGMDNPGGIAHGHIGEVAVGSFEDWDFRSPDTGAFVLDAQGVPVPQVRATVPFVIAVPSSPPPPQGYPVVVVQHGIGFSMMMVPVLANDLAGAGFVSVGIDAAAQGGRFDPTDRINNFTSVPEPDGFADLNPLSPLGFFDAFLNLPGMRDNFRQTVADQIQLVRILKSPDPGLSPVGAPPLDTGAIYYLSDSLGSIIGTQTLAVDPSYEAGVLNVGGGGIMNYLMPNSPEQFASYEGIVRLLAGLPDDDPIDRFSLFVNLVQTVLDGGDSMNYAPWIFRHPEAAGRAGLRAPDILMVEVVGDQSMPNAATEALSRAMGLALVSPFLEPVAGLAVGTSPVRNNVATPAGGVTAGLVQYSPAPHSDNLKRQFGELRFCPGFPYPSGPDGPRFPRLDQPVTVPEPNAELLTQIRHFLQTHRETGHGEIVSTQTPRPFLNPAD